MNRRTTKYAAPTAIAIPATMSTALNAGGSGPAAAANTTSSRRMATPPTMRRPGIVRSSTWRRPLCASGSGTTNGRRPRERAMYVDFAILTDVSYTAREAQTLRTLQHRVSARGAGARSVDRCHHHADLSDVHLCPGRAGQAQRVRVRADAES